jgi:hypothetical protein
VGRGGIHHVDAGVTNTEELFMTLVDMARETKMPYDFVTGEPIYLEKLKAFADLVRADEREACHALRQTLPNPHEHCQVSAHAYDMAIAAYGAAIRARGNT